LNGTARRRKLSTLIILQFRQKSNRGQRCYAHIRGLFWRETRRTCGSLWTRDLAPLPGKTEGFSNKMILYIKTLYGSFGDNKIFGRNAVMELLGLKSSGASKLISNLMQADIIESVSGYGKGKYRFKI
jgi:fic protein